MKKNKSVQVALVLTAVFGGIEATSAEPKAADGSPTAEPTGSMYLKPRDRFMYGPVFGAPSGWSMEAKCTDLQWSSALNIAATGAFVDALGVQCIDKAMIGPPVDLYIAGPAAASAMAYGCYAKQVPTCLYGRSGSVIDRLGFLCREWRDAADSGDRGDDSGGSGGTSFSWECPRGYWLVGLRTWIGTWINAVQPICRYDP